jgi:hypothetical protein
MPKNTIDEKDLTDEQIRIVESENKKINNENFTNSWIGMKNGDGWDFMRHGFEVIHIYGERGNICRKKLAPIIEKLYNK